MTQRSRIVIGIDVALKQSGVVLIEDGKYGWSATVKVEGDTEDTGPRYAMLRLALERLFQKKGIGYADVIAIEQPEHALRQRKIKGRNVRVSADPGNIMKLYGAFAVAYAECARLFPGAEVMGVLPERWKGNLKKHLTASIFAAKYDIRQFANWDEADALGIADFAWDHLQARLRKALKDRQ